jgi:hypothetical protein
MKETSITLTPREIMSLAKAAGFIVQDINQALDEDSMDCEYTILEREGGVEILDDDHTPRRYAHGAWITEYPEEGTFPLGPEITPKNHDTSEQDQSIQP